MNQPQEIKLTKIYSDAGGTIHFGDAVPDGCLMIAHDDKSRLENVLGAIARLAYDGCYWLVPGIPEAVPNSPEALDAFMAFYKRFQAYLYPNKLLNKIMAGTVVTVDTIFWLATIQEGQDWPCLLEEMLCRYDLPEMEQAFRLPLRELFGDELGKGQKHLFQDDIERLLDFLADWNRYGLLADVGFPKRHYADPASDEYSIRHTLHYQLLYAETTDELQEQIIEAAEVWAAHDKENQKGSEAQDTPPKES